MTVLLSIKINMTAELLPRMGFVVSSSLGVNIFEAVGICSNQ